MPKYKCMTADPITGEAYTQPVVYKGTVYMPGDYIETDIYLSQKYMDTFKLSFETDAPYVSPIIQSTGKLSSDETITIGDYGYNFDVIITTEASCAVNITFNGDTSKEIYIGENTSCTKLIENTNGREIRTIDIEVETGSTGNYCLWLCKHTNFTYTEA